MNQHTLSLRYDGRLAGRHLMDAGDSHAVIEGAKRFLAAHAQFYLSGDIPDKLQASGSGFQIYHRGMQGGSCIYDFVADISADAAWDAAKLAFELFLLHSFLSWRDGHAVEIPEAMWRQPFLASLREGTNRPLVGDREAQRDRLHQRITQSRQQITMPLGRSAEAVEMRCNDKTLGTFTQRVYRWDEDDITNAVLDLRRQLQDVRRAH